MTEFHVREPSSEESSSTPAPRVKPAPNTSKISVPFSYTPSDDGTDENLLILLHGLGDTHLPFSKLAKQLKLPQTAVLALRAPEQIPFLYEEAYQWYTSFDQLGELIDRPNPTPSLDFLSNVIKYLTKDCTWSLSRVHLFGFGQGGSVAAEYALHVWKEHLQTTPKEDQAGSSTDISGSCLASVITIGGPLLSYPTLSITCPTPILVAYRTSPAEPSLTTSDLASFKRAFKSVIDTKLAHKGQGMPASREEWEPIMRFWSQSLPKRKIDGLYEVMSGVSTT